MRIATAVRTIEGQSLPRSSEATRRLRLLPSSLVLFRHVGKRTLSITYIDGTMAFVEEAIVNRTGIAIVAIIVAVAAICKGHVVAAEICEADVLRANIAIIAT